MFSVNREKKWEEQARVWKAIKEKLKEERRKRHECGGRCAKRKKRKKCKQLKSTIGKRRCEAKNRGRNSKKI